LWLPLLLLSASVPGLEGVKIIPPTSGSVEISLENHLPFYYQSLTSRDLDHSLSQSYFNEMRKSWDAFGKDRNQVQLVELPKFSEMVWELTPRGREELLSDLLNKDIKQFFTTKFTFNRNSAASDLVTFEYIMNINDMEIRQTLYEVINNGTGSNITITGLFPRIIKMPGTSEEASNGCEGDEECMKFDISLSYYATGDEKDKDDYWSMNQLGTPCKFDDSCSVLNNTNYTSIFLINTPVSSQDSLLGQLAAFGLIGLYTGIVLYVSNIIRGLTSNWTSRIMFVNLPDPRRLLRLCQDIILARMDGDLLLEEELSNELLQVYRSPESLIENTRLRLEPDKADNDGGEDGNMDDEEDDDDDDDDNEAGNSRMRHRRATQN